MFNLPLVYFLYLFFAVMIIWLFFSLAGIVHLLHFGNKDRKAPLFTLVYLAGSVVIGLMFLQFYNTTDWTANFSLSLPASGFEENIIE